MQVNLTFHILHNSITFYFKHNSGLSVSFVMITCMLQKHIIHLNKFHISKRDIMAFMFFGTCLNCKSSNICKNTYNVLKNCINKSQCEKKKYIFCVMLTGCHTISELRIFYSNVYIITLNIITKLFFKKQCLTIPVYQYKNSTKQL